MNYRREIESRAAFRKYLADVIREDSKTLAAFARKCGKTRGWLTQLTDENRAGEISYQTVALICRNLKNRSAAKAVYTRFQHVFSPDPNAVEIEFSDEGIATAFVDRSKDLVADGYRTYVQKQAGVMFRRYRQIPGKELFAVRAAMVVADSYFAQGLQPRGMGVLNSIKPLVQTYSSVRLTFDYRMLIAIGYRGLGRKYLGQAASEFKQLGDMVPLLPRRERSTATQGLDRDMTLSAWDRARFEGSPGHLQQAVVHLAHSLDDIENEVERNLAKEVAARGFISLGSFEQAERLLEDIASQQTSPLMQAKRQVTEIRLHLAKGDVPAAQSSFHSAMQLCELNGFGHYHREAFRLQDELIGS